jgi:hypothetical protein
MKLILLATIATLTFSANAGSVVDTMFSTQALIYQSNGVIDGCGVRFVGIQEITSKNQPIRTVDGSFSIFSPAVGLTKLGMSKTNSTDVLNRNMNATQVPIKSYWMRRVGGKITKPVDGKSSPSKDTKGFLLQKVEVDDFIDLLKVLNSDNEFQVGVTSQQENSEWIFAGKLKTSEADSARLAECLKSFSKTN